MSECTLQDMVTLLDGRHVLNLPAIQSGLKAAIAREAELRAENERLEEKCNKFMWQVRDTCVRAENAEQRNTELEAQIRLHAGDTISLTNELNEWRDRANAAEAAGAQSVSDRLRKHLEQIIAYAKYNRRRYAISTQARVSCDDIVAEAEIALSLLATPVAENAAKGGAK